MAQTLAGYFKSGELWVKSYKTNYELQRFPTVDYTPDVFEKDSKIDTSVNNILNKQIYEIPTKL